VIRYKPVVETFILPSFELPDSNSRVAAQTRPQDKAKAAATAGLNNVLELMRHSKPLSLH